MSQTDPTAPLPDNHKALPQAAWCAQATAVFACLEGGWRLDRAIRPQGRFVGEAAFTRRAPGVFDYVERGVLHLPNGAELAANRAYRYELADPYIDIVFADGPSTGQRFVRLAWRADVAAWRATELHLCAADRYDVTLHIDEREAFTVDVAVRGPRKAYNTSTRFSRNDASL
ncbi:DUF6314 family protein [Chitinasiproducens palmae]|uniref:DUF6314 domain-containing protein n=1 Tax=Chitinasiproducens palmae TaxID=1770053 RepID=A0A1H2PRQ5_9BURK|nr:DUF6314 family protein [Chitinasiproducens palmae]SDV49158.1 hypothetical protein SAMN05216551_107113 [Chitinasiproducens palmae]